MKNIQLIALFLTVLTTIVSQNVLVNGNFNEPLRILDKAIITSLPGWQINKVEQGVGYLYNLRWLIGRNVIQLDSSNRNDFLRQTVNIGPGQYKFSILYAARSLAVSTSAFSVHWNGVQVSYVQATDELIRTLNIFVYSFGGQNTIEIRGQGPADGRGMTVSGASLTPICVPTTLDTSSNLIKNGNFNQPTRVSGYGYLTCLPYWQVSDEAEQGIGTIYNSQYPASTVVIELDGRENINLKQRVLLNPGTYILKCDYAARQGKPLQTSRAKIYLNDQQLADLQPYDYSINSLQIQFNIFDDSPAQSIIQFRADGPSDTYGLTITNVVLEPCQSGGFGGGCEEILGNIKPTY